MKTNNSLFILYCIRLALSLDKRRGASTIKIKNCIFYFVLCSACSIFAETKKDTNV